MQPRDEQALEADAWRKFVKDLGGQLALAWPAMQQRLADRYDAFVEHATVQALQHGITRAPAVARFVNLCAVWGPSFQERAGFEWARGLLAAPPAREWSTVHQLVRRSLAELARRPEARVEPAALESVDAGLLDRYGAWGRRGAMLAADPPPAPRKACDLEAAELRQLETEPLKVYRCVADEWQRIALPPPAPLRLSLAHETPALVGLVTAPRGLGEPTRLQARLRAHTVCDGDHHPAIGFAGSHGLWQWRGHETRGVNWPVSTLEQALPKAGPGTAVAEETSPEIHRLDFEVCGLRDEGDALGATRLQVWAWPATQWWLEIVRQAAEAGPIGPREEDMARGSTQVELEADGRKQDTAGLQRGFEHELDEATVQAVQLLRTFWAKVPGLEDPAVEGRLGMLAGRAALAWGWCPSADGLGARAVMQVHGELDMAACRCDLVFSGALALGDGRAQISLKLTGEPPLRHQLQRDQDEPPLLALVTPLVTRFELPVEVELEPLAGEAGSVLQRAGPARGALVGEAGLRPRTTGGSGWEWYAMLRLEPVQLPLRVSEPLTGERVLDLTLMPAMTLIDWRLG